MLETAPTHADRAVSAAARAVAVSPPPMVQVRGLKMYFPMCLLVRDKVRCFPK